MDINFEPRNVPEIEFAGKKYLTDFYWINVSNVQKKVWESEAKLRAAKHNRSLCLLRIGRVQRQPFQYGLRESMPKVKLNKIPRSLALSVVNGFPQRNYLGFFAIAGGWWVVTMWNGQLMLSGDRFFTSKEEATEFFFAVKGMHQWENNEVVNLSEEPQESELRLTAFMEEGDYANRNGYIDFNVKQPVNYSAVILLLLAALGGAVWYYWEEIFPPETIPPKSSEELFPLAWKEEPMPWDVFSACEDAMNKITFSENLWILKNAVCTKGSLKLTYNRNAEGSYLYLPKGAAMDEANHNVAIRNVPLPKLPVRKSDKICEQRTTYINLLEFFRVMGVYGAKASLNSSPPETIADGEPPVEVRATFGKITYKIITSGFPREIYRYVSNIPGCTLQSVKIDVHERSFTYEFNGTIYGTSN